MQNDEFSFRVHHSYFNVQLNGGEGGIRTHGGRKPTPVFETGALIHYATSPAKARIRDEGGRINKGKRDFSHYAFILHPSSFPPCSKELLHQLAALSFQYSFDYFNAVI